MKTPPNSVRTIDPVGHASRQPACSQCLQTSEEKSQAGRPSRRCSTNFTCRQLEWPSPPVLSYDMPVQVNPSCGTSFHSLHATSQALQPMQTVESVKNPVVDTAASGLNPHCS